VVLHHGFELQSAEGQAKAGAFILENLTRVLNERRTFEARSAAARSAASLDSAKGADAAPSTLVERSELFRDRGVSLDTGILANFSVDLALRTLKDRGVLKPGQVARVAVIGPGLSFIDKDEPAAFDYFPLQTVQPFALMDSLLQTGLAEERSVSLTAFDISPLLLGHVQRVRQRAEKGGGYVIQLPQDAGRSWPPALEKYWQSFGRRVGSEVKALPPPATFTGLKTRAVQIRPQTVLRCQAVDLDMVAQRLVLSANDRFDLIVATNVFLYYDAFEQALALQNVGSMVNPGGVLLANDDLPLLPASGMRRVNVTAISDGASGRDAVAAYQKQ
jgi:SAM-dependent methyltransferase